MHCTHAYWVVEFTMRYDVVFLNLQTELEGEQYTVGKLMELPSSRCHRHCLKAMYDSMPRSRTEVDVSCTFTQHARTLWES